MSALIISPHGGLGNRLRSINSAMLIAHETGRQIHHAWLPGSKLWTIGESSVWADWYKRMRLYSFEDFFDPEPPLPAVGEGWKVDQVLSEWAPGDWWFPMQSSGQEYLRVAAASRSQDAFKAVASSNAEVILLETTLRTWPHDYPGIHRVLPQGEVKARIHDFYKFLRPKKKYLDLLAHIPSVDAGLWIRQGDLGNYFRAADQSFDAIAEWIDRLKLKFSSVAIFSIDDEIVDHFYLRCQINVPSGLFSREVCDLPRHEKAMFDFLFLALKCEHIYGTPGSSFAQEASLYGLKHYGEIMGG